MNFWEQIEPELVKAVAIVVPVATGVAVGWLRQRARTWGIVRDAVRQAEETGSEPGSFLTGEEKHQLALGLLARVKPGLKSERASQMIEQVLPQVRRESEAPPPRTPQSG